MLNAQVFYEMLSLLLRDPCLILMLGDWRTGKTDTSLLIAHLAKKWGLIHKIGSNIYTYDNPAVQYITAFGTMKRWIHHDALTKLFLFDEALTHLPARRAMSKKNVDMNALIAELSKGHGRIIFCSQTDKVESTLKDSAFCRAIFKKTRKKVMVCSSKLFEPLVFTGLPKSPIKFDKDRLAIFSEIEGVLYSDLSEEMKIATLYGKGMSMNKIADKMELHDTQVKRAVMKVCNAFVKREQLEVVNPPK